VSAKFVIIDMGIGNPGSIQNMLKKINCTSIISSDQEDIKSAEKLILPGVGSFDSVMKRIDDLQIKEVLQDQVIKNNIPILGICLGIQIFTKGSEEGLLPGLGWIDAITVRFSFSDNLNLKIPHMGWNTTTLHKENLLFEEMHPDARFYFVHSYHIVCHDSTDILSTTHYGYDFVSSIQKNNIYGTQFHPEKSHKYGMKIFENFSELC
jgi:glutamine amidotransferase